VRGQTKQLQGSLGSEDKEKLEEYLDSVRGCEQKLATAGVWVTKEKPKVQVPPPKDIAFDDKDTIGWSRVMYDMMHLALQTDSTRIITYDVAGEAGVVPIAGVELGYHALSHHGLRPERITQLRLIEEQHMKAFRDFLAKLKGTQEEGETLLERTMVLMGSPLGNAANHNAYNLPILLAGGGFRHGQYLAFDPNNNKPLCNLYVSMLQQMGLPIDRFSISTGTQEGLAAKKT
jgi:hypothetical protein